MTAVYTRANNMRMDSHLLTSEDIAQRFGVKVETVRAWVRAGRVPCIRASRKIVRFRIDEVEAALRQEVTATLGREDQEKI